MTTSEDQALEAWRPVLGFEGLYEVSDRGRVRSLDRTVLRTDQRSGESHDITYRGRLLALQRQAKGYVGVVLWQDGKGNSRRAHQLVLEAFVGPRPDGMETLHGNGVRHDNRLANLRWGTWEENHADRERHGTIQGGHRAQTHCKRGHLLLAPNLQLRTGRVVRSCLACGRALSVWHWMERDKPGHGEDREPWLQTRSDQSYAEIMSPDRAGSSARSVPGGR